MSVSEPTPSEERPLAKAEVRKVGWKNLGVSAVWFLVAIGLVAMGLIGPIDRVCCS